MWILEENRHSNILALDVDIRVCSGLYVDIRGYGQQRRGRSRTRLPKQSYLMRLIRVVNECHWFSMNFFLLVRLVKFAVFLSETAAPSKIELELERISA